MLLSEYLKNQIETYVGMLKRFLIKKYADISNWTSDWFQNNYSNNQITSWHRFKAIKIFNSELNEEK